MALSRFDQYQRSNENYPPEVDNKISKLTVLDHFGIFTNIPTTIFLKLSALTILILLIELNSFVNLESLHPKLVDLIGEGGRSYLGVSLIGLFLGILFRYMDFELVRLKLFPKEQKSGRLKSYLTLIFLLAITLFIVLEVIVEIINARGLLRYQPGGALFAIDLMNILIMTIGTYAIFSTNRKLIIVMVLLMFIIMCLGIDYGFNIPLMVILAILFLLYIEAADGSLRIHEHIIKFHNIIEKHDTEGRLRMHIDKQMNYFSKQFAKNLVLFIILTTLISGILLLVHASYPYITPSFIYENLELQMVYALAPIFGLLFFAFFVYYVTTRYILPYRQNK